jgi:hypothetical protein
MRLDIERGAAHQATDRMGEETRYRRFLGYKKRLSARDLDTLTNVDHHRHEALVALDAQTAEAVGISCTSRRRARSPSSIP